jgi:hypothetical protein
MPAQSIRYEIHDCTVRFHALEYQAQRQAAAQQRFHGGTWRPAQVEGYQGWLAVDDQGHASDWSGNVPSHIVAQLKIPARKVDGEDMLLSLGYGMIAAGTTAYAMKNTLGPMVIGLCRRGNLTLSNVLVTSVAAVPLSALCVLAGALWPVYLPYIGYNAWKYPNWKPYVPGNPLPDTQEGS